MQNSPTKETIDANSNTKQELTSVRYHTPTVKIFAGQVQSQYFQQHQKKSVIAVHPQQKSLPPNWLQPKK